MTYNFNVESSVAAEIAKRKYELYCREKYLNSEIFAYAIEKVVISAISLFDYASNSFDHRLISIDGILDNPRYIRADRYDPEEGNYNAYISFKYDFKDYYDSKLAISKVDLDLVNALLKEKTIKLDSEQDRGDLKVTIYFNASILGLDNLEEKKEQIKQKTYLECRKNNNNNN